MTYTYEVAISFAGEARAFAEAVVKGLKDAEELWSEDLSIKLSGNWDNPL